MKQFSIKAVTLVLAVCGCLQASATTLTVNNGSYLPANPGQYSTISAAISAATAGDTILVAGSLTPYSETLSISIKLTIIGAGFNPQDGPSTVLNGNINFYGSNGSYTYGACSGTTIMGLYVEGTISDEGYEWTVNDITLYGNYINSLNLNNCYSHFTATGNVFYNSSVRLNDNYTITDSFVTFENNIFEYNTYIWESNSGSTNAQMVIDHNLFLAGDYSNPSVTNYSNYAIQTSNAYITNNIFYGVVPIDTNNSSAYTSNSFDNNLTYCSTTIKALPWGGNIGVSNINNSSPLFTSIFTSSSQPYLSFNGDNLRPQSGSPVLYAATDSTNIGPTGGQYAIYDNTRPFISGEPPIPMVETITPISSTSVHAGTPFVIQVTAKEIK